MIFHNHPSQELKKNQKNNSLTPLTRQGWRGADADETNKQNILPNAEVHIF